MASRRTSFAGQLASLFHGRSSLSSQQSSDAILSPKSPAPRLGLSILTSPTIDLPGLPSHESRSRSPRSAETQRSVRERNEITIPSSARSRNFGGNVLPERSPSGQSTWGWEDVRDSAGGRTRRRRRAQTRPRGARGILREKEGRMKLLRCLGFGLLLAVGISVYLALTLSGSIQGTNIHVLVIVVGLLLVMAFSHATVRLGMYILRPPEYPSDQSSSLTMVEPGTAIPITLRRDEEDFSDPEENGVPKDAVLPAPPPAYGFWKGSTRMNPNLIHWRKLGSLQSRRSASNCHNTTAQQSQNRPPSYATDDGVRYLQDVQPHSMAPAMTSPLPIHPSERGRVAMDML